MSNLLILFLIPFILAVVVLLLPFSGRHLKFIAFILSLLPLLYLMAGFTHWLNAQVEYAWLPSLAIEFNLAMDPLSLVFVYLTAIIIPISILATESESLFFSHSFYSLIFLLEGLLIGFFISRDLVFFTLFWEAMLIPLYFIIAVWGGVNKHMAAIKFIIYMIAGSALMISAVLWLYLGSYSTTFNMDLLSKAASESSYAYWICGFFLIAFAVKTPLFPFHAWLPDAYTQAPTAGTILLAGLLSKAGIYGIARIVWDLFPKIVQEWSLLLLILAIVGALYGAFAAWMQNDFKRLIAYSSFSHVNFILAGLFIWNETAHQGAILQALNHGITITALFLVSGWLEERIGSTAIGTVKGMAKFLPYLCWLTLFFVLSSVALPGMNNFIGELLILFGLFGYSPWLTAILGLTVIFSVVYMLRWMQRVYFEEPGFFQKSWADISSKEMAIALPLVLLILWVGIYPAPLLNLLASGSKL